LALGRIEKKIARFKILENSRLWFQNDLAFLGRNEKPSLSEFPEIYALPFLSNGLIDRNGDDSRMFEQIADQFHLSKENTSQM
jgi:hypothetical protein